MSDSFKALVDTSAKSQHQAYHVLEGRRLRQARHAYLRQCDMITTTREPISSAIQITNFYPVRCFSEKANIMALLAIFSATFCYEVAIAAGGADFGDSSSRKGKEILDEQSASSTSNGVIMSAGNDAGPWCGKLDNVAVYSLKGGRKYMEDRYNIEKDNSMMGFAIYDGHSGSQMADFAAKNLVPSLITKLANSDTSDVQKLISEAIISMDKGAKKHMPINPGHVFPGSTAVIGLLHQTMLYIANVGDSRAVAKRSDGTVWQITKDHKVNDPKERRKIKKRGGDPKLQRRVWRVGGLAVSRSLGDYQARPLGLALIPDVFLIDLEKTPLDYVILASDGVWDVVSNEEAVDIVSPFIDNEGSYFGAEVLAQWAVSIRRRLSDNISVMVIKLQ